MKFTNLSMVLVVFNLASVLVLADKCGCKALSRCYARMLDLLHEQEEAHCVENAAIGTSTITIYLQALQNFCGEVVTVNTTSSTHDMRNLYEVTIEYNSPDYSNERKDKPTVIIDAGQEGGMKSVRFALYIIQQLVGCVENTEMIESVKWVIMPSVNPDGLEFSRYKNHDWTKNLNVDDEAISFGVDISRNFDENWAGCSKIKNRFANNYPGPAPASEKETIFVKDVLNRHKANAKFYLSIRRNGHHIGYPYAFSKNAANRKEQLETIAAAVSSKVNIRSGGVNIFKNDSIFNLEGGPRCGHSVDYAYSVGIPWPYEFRIYLESDNRIMSMFQTMPRGYENMLGSGYFSGIREIYSVLTNKKKYGHLLKAPGKH